MKSTEDFSSMKEVGIDLLSDLLGVAEQGSALVGGHGDGEWCGCGRDAQQSVQWSWSKSKPDGWMDCV